MCDNCGCGKMAETFRAPYAGSDALSSIDFSKAQITNTIGTGDFDHASLNSSGHQNIFANAESFEANGSGDKMTFGRMEWSWDCDEDDVDEDRINDLIEDEIQQDGAESGSGTLTEQNEEGVSYDINYRWNHVFSDYNTAETGYHAAESFAAASTARPDLPREKRNVLSSIKANYDPSFSWASCSWGPYFNRFSAEGSNKFYSVWVWERSPGIYTAMGAYGGLGQNPRLFNVGQTRDLQQAVNMAKKKLQSKQKKGYQTYSAEYISSLSNGIVQFEDGSGFSSASAPPDGVFAASSDENIHVTFKIQDADYATFYHTMLVPSGLSDDEIVQYAFGRNEASEDNEWFYIPSDWEGVGEHYLAKIMSRSFDDNQLHAEEGNAPVQDPMELGEMANWTPMDGSEGLKRKRAESQVFALTYFLQNDVNMEDITDVTEALELYLSLSEDIAEMDASGLQKHPRYEVANRMLSDLSYRLDDLQTQLPEIDVDIEMDAEYDAWRSAFTDGAAATQIHKYDRNWMQKVMNPKSRQVKAMWGDAEPDFMQELKSAEDKNLNPTNKLGLPNYDPYAKGGVFHQSFMDYHSPLSWGLAIVGAFFLGKKL